MWVLYVININFHLVELIFCFTNLFARIRNLSNTGNTAPIGHTHSSGTTPTTPIGRKLPLADHRYGKEEMIALYPDPIVYPQDMSNISTIVRPNRVPPFAFIPLTEKEQVSMNEWVDEWMD